MFRFFFLINPVSGGGQGKTIYEFLPEIMQSMGFNSAEWQAEFTEKENFETQISKAISTTETLIAVGGDGTVSAVFSNMMHHPDKQRVKIGLIPLGTGNDLARVLGLYKPFVEKGLLYLLRRLLLASSRTFDIWEVNGNLAFANYFSAGIDARIAHDFNQDRKEGKISSNSVVANKMHYVKRFFADRNYFLQNGKLSYTEVDGKIKTLDVSGFRTVIVGNIPSFASGTNPFYCSDMSDKILEIVCAPNLLAFLGAIAIGNIPFLGHLYKKYFLHSYKATSLELEVLPSEYLQLDGEDLTGQGVEKVSIRYGYQVQMLALGG